MKKLIIATAIICSAIVSHAAAVVWQATATATYNGQTMYLLTSIETSYASVDVFKSAAVDSSVVKKVAASYKTTQKEASDDSITPSASFYLAVIDSTDATKIHYMDVTTGMKEYVYAPPNSSPGTYVVSFADVATSTTTTTIAPVPEPTSGLMLLLGVAGLALRRKRA